ncbi:MAG: hypothetical protein HGA23_09770, partial [Bacteroidales bacterium]|nr:hypothetical protein [Bacteroidales bacterium]
ELVAEVGSHVEGAGGQHDLIRLGLVVVILTLLRAKNGHFVAIQDAEAVARDYLSVAKSWADIDRQMKEAAKAMDSGGETVAYAANVYQWQERRRQTSFRRFPEFRWFIRRRSTCRRCKTNNHNNGNGVTCSVLGKRDIACKKITDWPKNRRAVSLYLD